ncbi:MAG: hypothetical protein AB7K24_20295 [Gemmataceae bacterium]
MHRWLSRAMIALWIAGPIIIVVTGFMTVRATPRGKQLGYECPKCGKKTNVLSPANGLMCPSCKSNGAFTELVPRYAPGASAFGRVMGPILFETNLLFGTYILLFHFAQKRKQHVDEREFRRFNCPNCGQKLRYHMRRAGAAGQCPRCNDLFSFPEEGDEDPAYSARQDAESEP